MVASWLIGDMDDLVEHAADLNDQPGELGLYLFLGEENNPLLGDEPFHHRVRHLELGVDSYVPDAFPELLRAFAGLRSLSIFEPTGSGQMVRQMGSHLPASVRSFSVFGSVVTDFDDLVVAEFSKSPRMAPLRHLVLDSCRLGPAAAQHLAHGVFRGLETLRLGPGPTRYEQWKHTNNRIGPTGAKALATGPALAYLETLDLDFNSIGDAGARALASIVDRPFLTKLHLQANELSDAAVAALCDSPLLHQLSTLDLSHNHITAVGVRMLLDAAPRGLRRLWLWGNPIGNKGASLIANSPWVARLDELNVSGCHLTDRGLLALAESEHVRRIPTVGRSDPKSAKPATLIRLGNQSVITSETPDPPIDRDLVPIDRLTRRDVT